MQQFGVTYQNKKKESASLKLQNGIVLLDRTQLALLSKEGKRHKPVFSIDNAPIEKGFFVYRYTYDGFYDIKTAFFHEGDTKEFTKKLDESFKASLDKKERNLPNAIESLKTIAAQDGFLYFAIDGQLSVNYEHMTDLKEAFKEATYPVAIFEAPAPMKNEEETALTAKTLSLFDQHLNARGVLYIGIGLIAIIAAYAVFGVLNLKDNPNYLYGLIPCIAIIFFCPFLALKSPQSDKSFNKSLAIFIGVILGFTPIVVWSIYSWKRNLNPNVWAIWISLFYGLVLSLLSLLKKKAKD
jgi:hypothetical protein